MRDYPGLDAAVDPAVVTLPLLGADALNIASRKGYLL